MVRCGHTRFVFFGVISLFLYLGADCAKKGSLKKRLAKTSSDEEAPPTAAEPSSGSGSRNRRGALRQRIAEELTEPPTEPRTLFANDLKYEWAKGTISSVKVQKFALSALKSGAEGVDSLAAAGNFGQNPQNIFRALVKVFGIPVGAAPIEWVEIPTKHGRRTPHPVLMPHKFFQEVFKHRQNIWAERIAGSAGASSEACRLFWEGMKNSEFVKRHPNLPMFAWDRIVPFGVHGDGGKYNKQDSL